MTEALIILTTGILNFVLGVFVLLRNYKHPVNRTFALLSASLIAWTSFNFLADGAENNNLLYTRLTFVGAVFIALSVFWFSSIFPKGRGVNSRRTFVFEIISALVVALISLTPYLVPSVEKKGDFGVELEVGPLYFLYVLYIFHIIVLVVINFRRSMRTSDQLEKIQIRLLLYGIFTYASFALISNLILPILINNWSSSRFGPFFTLIFVAFTAYAIVRHRLLDIRLIVARSVGYLLFLFLFAGIYALVVFGIADAFFSDSEVPQAIISIAVSLLLIFTTPFFKRYIDKLSNSVFFRDAYNPQTFLGELNKTLASNIDIDKLLVNSIEIIERNIKTDFCSFFIRDTAYYKSRVVGKADLSLTSTEIDELTALLAKTHRRIVYTLDEPTNEVDARIVSLMKKTDINVLVRLVSTLDYEVNGIGFLLLGQKKSGNIFTSEDFRILDIISNELVIAIQNALRFEEIDQFNITLQKKIDDATRELKQSNEKLKALDEAKDEFVSMASHQLRTPLTSIKGYVSMVSEEDVGKLNNEQKKMLGQALFSSQRMVYLISDLLNVSRLKTGKFVIEAKPVYLPDVIESELDQLKEGVAAKNITLAYNKPKKFPAMNLDEMKIRQVIMNFTDNAIYYTPSGGKITIELKDKEDSVEFTVKDTGIGVPKSERHKLFTKFYRAENAKKARPDGTGLGLFMAKKVVIAQGGSIIFESREGKGSTFGFSFPKAGLLVDEVAKKEEKHE